ncbi:MAG TPA: hypothetical protein VGN64_00700, partial [Dyadobacter sp.]|nr:hypothetical protein [Dyadobacter sp.]
MFIYILGILSIFTSFSGKELSSSIQVDCKECIGGDISIIRYSAIVQVADTLYKSSFDNEIKSI